jgi:hypothetical protein
VTSPKCSDDSRGRRMKVISAALPFPKGSWFEVEAHFDNSDANPANQNKPPKVVRWGEGTNDEMCIGIFEWVVIEGEPEPERRRGGG